MTDSASLNCSSNLSEIGQSPSRKNSNPTIIRLVNSEKSSRPFLKVCDVQHLNMVSFEQLVRPTPFQKFRNMTSSAPVLPSPTSEILSSSFHETTSALSSLSLSVRKISCDSVSPSGILKDHERSRFSRSEKKTQSISIPRRVTIQGCIC